MNKEIIKFMVVTVLETVGAMVIGGLFVVGVVATVSELIEWIW